MSSECLFWAVKAKVGHPLQKLILVILADIANEKRQCWPGYDYIAERAECNRRSAIKHVKELGKKGLISVAHQDDGGVQKANIYTISGGVHEIHPGVHEMHGGGAPDAPNTPIDTQSIYNAHAKAVLIHLNTATGKHYRLIDSNLTPITARLKEDFSVEDCCRVIDRKAAQWMGTDQEKFLRPETLFRKSKFDGYLNEPDQQPAPASGKTRDRSLHDDINDRSWARGVS